MSGKLARLQARVPPDLLVQLQQQAASEGKEFNKWFNERILTLQQQYPGKITFEEGMIPVTNPTQFSPTIGAVGTAPFDELDAMVHDVRKMWIAKVMMDMLSNRRSLEDTYERIRDNGSHNKKDDDLSLADIMKLQMLQENAERRMFALREQYNTAKANNDPTGAAAAMNAITALIAAQGAQSQNFLQNQMALAQQNSQQQSTLFQTALEVSRQGQDDVRDVASDMQQSIDNLKETSHSQAVSTLQQINQIQVDNLKAEMERIRGSQSKDILTQLNELLKLRETSPIYKAAFNEAFGIKSEEGLLTTIIPQLKGLGIGNFIGKIIGGLTGMMQPKQVGLPGPLGMPEVGATPGPPPTPIQGIPIEELHLPQNNQVPQQIQSQPQPRKPINSNEPLSRQVEVPIPTIAPSITPETPQSYTNINTPEVQSPDLTRQIQVPQPQIEVLPTEVEPVPAEEPQSQYAREGEIQTYPEPDEIQQTQEQTPQPPQTGGDVGFRVGRKPGSKPKQRLENSIL